MKVIDTKKDSFFIISAILFLILGILLITNPDGVIKFITYILGAIIVISGIAKLIFYKKNKEAINNTNNMIIGITLIVIGIITMFLSSAITFVIKLILGGWLIYSGVVKLVLALKLKSVNIATWYVPLISSIVMILCGLYTIIFQNVFGIASGIVLVIYSIAEIIQFIVVPKNLNPDVIK